MFLGIKRSASDYIGAPKGRVKIHAGDELIIYGKLPILRTLDSHRACVHGDHDHELAVEKKQEAE